MSLPVKPIREFPDHKSRVNRGERKQYRYPDHHEGIVSRDVYQAASRMQEYRFYNSKKRLSGNECDRRWHFKGLCADDKDWKGFSRRTIYASVSVYKAEREEMLWLKSAEFSDGNQADLYGYGMSGTVLFTMREPALLHFKRQDAL
jgi:hypothetical protein